MHPGESKALLEYSSGQYHGSFGSLRQLDLQANKPLIPSTNDVVYYVVDVVLCTLYNTVYKSYLGSSEKNALLEADRSL